MNQNEIIVEMVREGLDLPFEKAYEHFKTLLKLEPKLVSSRTVQSWIIAHRDEIMDQNRKERENGRS